MKIRCGPDLRPVLVILGGEAGGGRTGGGSSPRAFLRWEGASSSGQGTPDLTALSSVQFGSRHHSSWVVSTACVR